MTGPKIEARGIEVLLSAGFTSVSLALLGTLIATPFATVAQGVAAVLPTIALLAVRNGRRKREARTEIAVTDGGDRR